MRIQLYTLMRIRIQLSKIMQIHADPGSPTLQVGETYSKTDQEATCIFLSLISALSAFFILSSNISFMRTLQK